ncbi:MAG: M14 family metallopeptidase [Minwuia sp.]|uniref:M14 family metallopeptidase n=1 Tax=Minwuia sp. TaxID=2493630 RepID=UPI003A8730A8
MSVSSHFSASYEEARSKFLDAAAAAGATLERFDNPAENPRGVDLSTDVARLGDPAAPAMLLTFSGTHGAEGFCGSGVQVAWLADGFWKEVPDSVQQVHVHAINPYGFASLSRTTEDNIDLNRNFVDHANPPVNEGWPKIQPVLCPTEWNDGTLDQMKAGVEAFVEEHGFWAFREAATSGQYRDPKGIFYGGSAPGWSRRTVETIVGKYCKGLKQLAVIDYHTGLGPRGFGERIIDHLPDTPGYGRAMDWYGGDASSPYLGTSTSAKLTGQMLDWIDRALTGTEVTAIALEYGTEPEDKVIGALTSDNWLRFHGDLSSARGREIKQKVRDAFYQDANDWKQMIWDRALDTQRLALQGLTR